jgi:hypothetical protein
LLDRTLGVLAERLDDADDGDALGHDAPVGRVRSLAPGAWLPGVCPVTVTTAPDSHRLPVYVSAADSTRPHA